MRVQGRDQRAGGELRIAGGEALQRLRQVPGPGPRVPDEQAERGAVQHAVGGAGEQGQRREAQQLAVGLGACVRRGAQPVGHRRHPPGRALVVRPPVHRTAHGRGLLLGERGQQLVPAPVGTVDQGLREVVQGAPPVCVQQGLRGGRHGRVGRRGQRPVVVEPGMRWGCTAVGSAARSRATASR